MMNSAEKFATSLVSLALIRNGYATSKDVQLSPTRSADILAVSEPGNKPQEKFVVEVEYLQNHDTFTTQLDIARRRFADLFGYPTYLAFYSDKENLLYVDDELRKRMKFVDEDVRLERVPHDVVVATEKGPA